MRKRNMIETIPASSNSDMPYNHDFEVTAENADYPIWIWDPDRLKIVWANHKALEFWHEESVLDMCEKDFPYDCEFAEDIRRRLPTIRDKMIVRERMTAAPAGIPIRIDCVLMKHHFANGRIGVRVEANRVIQGTGFELDRLREVISLSPFALSLFSEDGVLLLQNKADEITFGSGQRAGLIPRYGNKGTARDALKSVLMHGSYSHTHDLETSYGQKCRHRISFRRMHDPVTGASTVLAFMTDISDRYVTLTEHECSDSENEFPSTTTHCTYSSEHAQKMDNVHYISELSLNSSSNDITSDESSALLNTLSIGVMVISDDLSIKSINSSLLSSLGFNEDHNIQDLSLRSCFPRDYEYVETSIARLSGDKEGSHSSIDLVINSSNSGEIAWMLGNMRSFSSMGRTFVTLCLTDISTHKKAISRMKHDEKSRNAALSGIGVTSVFINSEGRIQRASLKEMAQILEMNEANLKHANLVDLLSSDSHKELINHMAEIQDHVDTDEKPSKKSVLLETAFGVSIEITAACSMENDGSWCLAIRKCNDKKGLSLNDIDDTSNIAAESEQMVANTCHELRTPLNALIGFTEIIRADAGALNNTRYKEYMDDIFDCSQQMLSTLNNMLDMHRLMSGKYNIDKTPVDLGEITGSVTRMLVPVAKKRRVVLNVNIDDKVPKVMGDEYTIRQSILNIVSNAIKYVAEAGTVYISLSIEPEFGVVVEISDNGLGMDANEIKRIMEPYQRLPGKDGGETGTGLGIPLAKSMAELNGIDFRIESEKGIGTIVRFVFSKSMIIHPKRNSGRRSR